MTADTARETARATATTAGVSAAGWKFSDRATTDSAATTRRPCRTGAATEVIGSGCRREATDTPSRLISASSARSWRSDWSGWPGSTVRSPASTCSWTGTGACASRMRPTPVACIGIRPPIRYSTRPAWWADSRSTSTASCPSRTASSTCWPVAWCRSSMYGSAAARSPCPRGASDAISSSRSPIT